MLLEKRRAIISRFFMALMPERIEEADANVRRTGAECA